MNEPLDLADDAALEALLAQLREGTGGAAPFTVDVADRVMARIAFAGPVPRSEVGLRQLALWAAAAAASGVAIVASAASRVPTVPEIVDGTNLAVKTGGTMAVLAGAAARTGAVLLEAGRATLQAVSPGEAALGAAVTATVLLMLGVTTYVVGRDLRTTSR